MKEDIQERNQSRYTRSDFTFRQLKRDYINFEKDYPEKLGNGFLNRILINYLEANKENDIFTDKLCKAMKTWQWLDNPEPKNGEIERIVINNGLRQILEKEYCSVLELENFSLNKLLSYLLDCYARLPLAEREQIYFYSVYAEICQAIASETEGKGTVIRIQHIESYDRNGTKEQTYTVKPYTVCIDENSMFNYLIGYAQKEEKNKDKEEFVLTVFRLSRITSCRRIKSKTFRLQGNEIYMIQKNYARYGASYAATKDSTEFFRVRLTEYGYRSLYLKIIARQRPIPCKKPIELEKDGKKFYDLLFDCSRIQMRNYFFSFGKEVEIIFPVSLRNQFIEELQATLAVYNSEQ